MNWSSVIAAIRTPRISAPIAAASGLTSIYQDTRDVQIYNNPLTSTSTLYISVDSTEGKSDNRSMIGSLGTPPATSLFTPPLPQTSAPIATASSPA